MGWCTVEQVREHNEMLTTEQGWDSGRIQRLINRTTREMKSVLRDTYGTHFSTWDAADVTAIPPELNDLCLQLAVVRGYIMAYRSNALDVPISNFIEQDEIKKQIKQIVDNLEIENVNGTVVAGTPTSCELQDYPDAADDDYHDFDSTDIDRWQDAG